MSESGKIALRDQMRAPTTARVGLARVGDGIGTQDWLEFKAAHAAARDAVHAELQVAALLHSLREMNLECVALATQASSRAEYLRRPDFGRRLSAESVELLREKAKADVSIVIADGLSALAVEQHAVPVMAALLPKLGEMKLSCTPVCVVAQGRVAVGDEIGAALGAKFSITLIGERPGLSAPDSLGVYMTWGPRIGRTDAERNCISNIRAEGLGYEEAAARIAWYAAAAFKLGMTGVALKDGAGKLL
jgi:ethanolamine ammonia-lyase small subunit